MQAFDPDLIFASDTSGDAIVFVGNNHFAELATRPIVEFAAQAGLPIRLWGTGWKRHQIAPSLQGLYLPNDQLGDVDRAAEIVLCDHMPSMRQAGYFSNRIYDALACGAAVISDPIDGLVPEFEPFVTQCETAEAFVNAVHTIRTAAPDQRETRRQFAASMPQRHSFDSRAVELGKAFSAVL